MRGAGLIYGPAEKGGKGGGGCSPTGKKKGWPNLAENPERRGCDDQSFFFGFIKACKKGIIEPAFCGGDRKGRKGGKGGRGGCSILSPTRKKRVFPPRTRRNIEGRGEHVSGSVQVPPRREKRAYTAQAAKGRENVQERQNRAYYTASKKERKKKKEFMVIHGAEKEKGRRISRYIVLGGGGGGKKKERGVHNNHPVTKRVPAFNCFKRSRKGKERKKREIICRMERTAVHFAKKEEEGKGIGNFTR